MCGGAVPGWVWRKEETLQLPTTLSSPWQLSLLGGHGWSLPKEPTSALWVFSPLLLPFKPFRERKSLQVRLQCNGHSGSQQTAHSRAEWVVSEEFTKGIVVSPNSVDPQKRLGPSSTQPQGGT